MNTEQSFTLSTFQQRENASVHSAYPSELAFFHAVQSGDMKKVQESMSPLDSRDFGTLSDNPFRNLCYHLVISIALITRFCIEAISALHRQMVFDFTNRMRRLKTRQVFSKPIRQCLDYIYENLHTPISLKNLADYVGLCPTYLSALFKKQVGATISAYIRGLRIDAAKNMLQYSEYTPIEIGNYLNFCSHSHFINVFRQETGMTPRQFKQQFFSRNWKT